MSRIILGVVIVLALAVVAVFFIFNPFAPQQSSMLTTAGSTSSTAAPASGLVVQDTTVGTGATAEPGDLVTVNYTGTLQDGTVFDTSVGKTPFEFVLGQGQVIPGWDEGVVGMKVGGTRTLIIPPSLGYGDQAVGPIPANSTLTFQMTLLDVTPAASSTEVAPEGAAAN